MRVKIQKSFTLIETIVVISVISLMTPLIFSIIFGLARQQTKIYRLSQVKREGDYILNTVSTLIKNNAYSIHYAEPPIDNNERCKSIETYISENKLIFKDTREDWFKIEWNRANEKISSYSSSTDTAIDLNSSSVLINNFLISCSRKSLYSPPTINISFDACYKTSAGNCTSNISQETAILHYQTKIKLRNF